MLFNFRYRSVNEDASWNKQLVIGPLFDAYWRQPIIGQSIIGAPLRPAVVLLWLVVTCGLLGSSRCVFRRCRSQHRTSFSSWYTATCQHRQPIRTQPMTVPTMSLNHWRTMSAVCKLIVYQLITWIRQNVENCQVKAAGQFVMVSECVWILQWWILCYPVV